MRFYLRNQLSAVSGRPTAAVATNTDAGHVGAQRNVCLAMSELPGDGAVSRTWAFPGLQPIHADFAAMFLGPPLNGQTFQAGGHFTVASSIKGMAAPETFGGFYLQVFAYLWRPNVGWVATLSAASAVSTVAVDAGRDWENNPTWRVFECDALGADIVALHGDRIVVELWHRFAIDDNDESTAGPYAHYFNGTQIGADLAVLTDPASYIAYTDPISPAVITLDPDNILVGARELLVDGTNVGALVGGTRIEIEEAEVEQQADLQPAPTRIDVVGRRLSLVCQIEAAQLQNLAIAWGLPAGAVMEEEDGTVVLTVEGASSRPIHEVIARGQGPGIDRTIRTIRVPRACVVKPVGHAYSKAEATQYEVHFLALADPNKVDTTLIEVWDEDGVFTFQQ